MGAIMWDHIKKHEITEAQIFLTRRCNTKCGACKLAESGKELNELSPFEWQIVFDNLEILGIKTVKVMGGEPTEVGMENLIKIIKYVSLYTNIKLALLSNSKWDKYLWLDELCDSGLYGYYASIDVVSGTSYSEGSLDKSLQGYQTLLQLQKDGRIPLLAANVVISKNNLCRVVSTVLELSRKGFYVNLCSFQCSDQTPTYNDTKIEYSYRKTAGTGDPVLTVMDIDLYRVIHDLLYLKRNRFKVSVPMSYLEKMFTYGLYGGTWQCDTFSQLRIDCDGIAMICNEFRDKSGMLPSLITPDIKSNKNSWTESFINHWYRERPKYDCQCYWSCFLQALENINNNSLEFEFTES